MSAARRPVFALKHTIRLNRTLHYTSPARFLPLSDLPPNPTSPDALGFAASVGERKRFLPEDLKIHVPLSSTSKKDIDMNSQTKKPERNFRAPSPRKNPLKEDASREVKTSVKPEADFFDGSDMASSPNTSKPRERRPHRMSNVSSDVVFGFGDSASPPDVQRQQFHKKRQFARGGEGRGQKKGGAASRSKRKSNRSDRDRPAFSEKDEATLRERIVTSRSIDHSSVGLFGKKCLVQDLGKTVDRGRALFQFPATSSPEETTLPSNTPPMLALPSSPPAAVKQAVTVAQWCVALNPYVRGEGKENMMGYVKAIVGKA